MTTVFLHIVKCSAQLKEVTGLPSGWYSGNVSVLCWAGLILLCLFLSETEPVNKHYLLLFGSVRNMNYHVPDCANAG